MCGREALAPLPVEFLSACMVEMLRRAAQWGLRYDFLRAADLERWRDTFRNDVAAPNMVGIDFLTESGVACVRPGAACAIVYCTLPVFMHIATKGEQRRTGSFHAHAVEHSRTHVHVTVDMHAHRSLLAPDAIHINVFARAPNNPTASLVMQLDTLGNHVSRTLPVRSDQRIEPAAVPALVPQRFACAVPARFLGPGACPGRRPPTGRDYLAVLSPVPVGLRFVSACACRGISRCVSLN